MDTSQPRISGNELGVFVFATNAERRRILRDQKFPKAVKVSRYQSASNAILRSLKKGVFSKEALLKELQAIENKPAKTKYHASVRRGNLTAVRRFLTIHEKAAPPDGEHTIIRQNAYFEFEGIKISVRPDILTTNVGGRFFTYSKLRFSSHKCSLDASEIVLLLIQKFTEQQDIEGLGFDASRARLIDCFSQHIFEAHHVSPYKGQLLMKALKEIRAHWPFIAEN
jgi:hypothetical protein